MVQQPNEYSSIKEVADRLGVHKNTVAKRIRYHNLPTVRVGNIILVRFQDVVSFQDFPYDRSKRGSKKAVSK